MKAILPIISATLLAGCSIGVKNGGDHPTESFVVPISYQEAHRLADAQGRKCEQLPDLSITGAVYTDNKTAVVRLSSPASVAPVEIVEIKALDDAQSQVTITVWGVGIWDKYELAAMRKTLETGKIACRGDDRAWNKK